MSDDQRVVMLHCPACGYYLGEAKGYACEGLRLICPRCKGEIIYRGAERRRTEGNARLYDQLTSQTASG